MNRLKVVLGAIIGIIILIGITGYFANTENQNEAIVEAQSDEIA